MELTLTREERICLAAADENESVYPNERNRTPLNNLVRMGFLSCNQNGLYTITTTGRNLIR